MELNKMLLESEDKPKAKNESEHRRHMKIVCKRRCTAEKEISQYKN